ncbi:hypothetical protein AAC387_Pa11g1274 [Persea americana]
MVWSIDVQPNLDVARCNLEFDMQATRMNLTKCVKKSFHTVLTSSNDQNAHFQIHKPQPFFYLQFIPAVSISTLELGSLNLRAPNAYGAEKEAGVCASSRLVQNNHHHQLSSHSPHV